MAPLKENSEREMLKYEKPSEFRTKIEKCDLIQPMKVGFLKCLSSLKFKHNKFLVLILIYVTHWITSSIFGSRIG
jgi:hypothetical protein